MHDSRVAAELHVLHEAQVVALAEAAGKYVLTAYDIAGAGAGFRARLLFIGG